MRRWVAVAVSAMALVILVVGMRSVAGVTAVTPLIDLNKAGLGSNYVQRSEIDPGRVSTLFYVNSYADTAVFINQWVHWYGREETAVANYNEHHTENLYTFSGEWEPYLIELPRNAGVKSLFFCVQPAAQPETIRCEYRGQNGRWTVHTEFNSRDFDQLSPAQIEALAAQIHAELAK